MTRLANVTGQSVLDVSGELGPLIEALDQPYFLDLMFQWLCIQVPHQQLNIYRYVRPARGHAVSEVQALYWSSQEQHLHEYPQLQAFVSRYWQEDPALSVIESLTEPCLFVSGTDQLSPDYLADCYPGGQSVDCDLLCEFGNDVLMMALYRWQGAARFSLQELSTLKQLWKLVQPLLVQHLRIQQLQALASQGSVTLRFQQKLERLRVRLSPQEYRLCLALLDGQQLPAIAKDMGVAVPTARTYQLRAFAKLDITTQHDLFRWAT